MLRLVSHFPRPVYCTTKISHSRGARVAPTHSVLSQNRTVGKSERASSRSYPTEYSVTASMSKPNAIAPGAWRRYHDVSASAADMMAEAATGIKYGVNCQCIGLLFFLPSTCMASQVPASLLQTEE